MNHSINIFPEEILDQVLQVSSAISLTQLSLVCRRLRILTWRHICREVTLKRDPTQIFSFLQFILSNTRVLQPSVIEGPGRHVFDLSITSLAFRKEVNFFKYEMSDKDARVLDWGPLLSRALLVMPNLRSFILEERVEQLTSHCPEFASILFSRKSITSIALGRIGPTSHYHFEKAMDARKDPWNLRTVYLHGPPGPHTQILQRNCGMGPLLLANRFSLTEIGFDRWNLRHFMSDAQANTQGNETTSVFPNVSSLLLNACQILVTDLASTFPSLQTLVLGSSPFVGNIMEQPSGSFPDLVSITGYYHDIYSFLTVNVDRSSIRRLVVNHWDIDDPGVRGFSVLQATPSLKSFSFVLGDVPRLRWWNDLADHIPNLNFLDVSLVVSNRSALDCSVNHVHCTLKNVPLLFLSLTLEGMQWLLMNETIKDDEEHVEDLLDLNTVALAYARSILTLQYIRICKRARSPKKCTILKEVTASCKIVRRPSLNVPDSVERVELVDPSEGQLLKTSYEMQEYLNADP